MKMQEVNMELLAFDSTDVITTSGIDFDDSSIDVIWLQPSSIKNYNNFARDASESLLYYSDTFDTTYSWISYGGTNILDRWTPAGETKKIGEADPPGGKRYVYSNGDGFQAVLDWLEEHKTSF